jgi:hypothetical protein
MSLPAGTQLTYFDFRRAWFPSNERAVSISADVSEPGGGQGWSFEVAEVDLGEHGTALQVRVFDDGFAAFRDIPGFFRELALVPDLTLNGVIFLLRELGAADRTLTEAPYAPETSAQEKAAAVIRNFPAGTRDHKQALAAAAAVLAELGIS